MKTKGFTLVELLVVIAILAILATVSVVGYTSFIEDSKNSVAMQELTQVRDYVVAKSYLPGNTFNVETANLKTDLGLDGTIAKCTDCKGDVVYVYTSGEGTAWWNYKTGDVGSGASHTHTVAPNP